MFGSQGHAGPDAAEGAADGERGPSAADALVTVAAPPALLDAADLDSDVGVGADQDAVGEYAMLPAALEKSTLDEQDGNGPGLVTLSSGTDGPSWSSATPPDFGSLVRYGLVSSGASVQTGKMVSGPAWTGEPRWSAGIATIVLPLL